MHIMPLLSTFTLDLASCLLLSKLIIARQKFLQKPSMGFFRILRSAFPGTDFAILVSTVENVSINISKQLQEFATPSWQSS
jgi:hypothetical protein